MSAVAKLVKFLRVGYPEAAPPTGYFAALALLRRRLSDDEVSAVATDLTACSDVLTDGIDIGVAITRLTHELPAPEDVDRIKDCLKGCRWP